MRRDAQINNEIGRLTAALKNHRLSREARMVLREQVNVLTLRLTPTQVRDRYYEQHRLLWIVLDITARWLAEEDGINPPSHGL